MEKIELLFEKYSIKPVLGVIPTNKDDELLSWPKKDDFWKQVRIWKDKGWEIAMHGYTHVYDNTCNNDDYFNYGGGSEFFGHSLETQLDRIKNGLKKKQSMPICLPIHIAQQKGVLLMRLFFQMKPETGLFKDLKC